MQHSRAPIPVRLAPVIRNPPSSALVLVSEGYVIAAYHTVENTKYCTVTREVGVRLKNLHHTKKVCQLHSDLALV